MPLPRIVARFNRVFSNRILGLVAGHLPGFAKVYHRGRRSGRSYCTPVCVFRREDGFRFALTYSSDTDWVRNLMAAGEATMLSQGRMFHLSEPRLGVDSGRGWMPLAPRLLLGCIGANEYLQCRAEPDPG